MSYVQFQLYQHTEKMIKLDRILTENEGNIEELDDQMLEFLESNKDDARELIDTIMDLIKDREAKAEAQMKESKRIAQLAMKNTSKATTLHESLFGFMNRSGLKQVETDKHLVKVVGKGGTRAIALTEGYVKDLQQLPSLFWKEKLTISKNNDHFKAVFKDGVENTEGTEFMKLIEEEDGTKILQTEDGVEIARQLPLGTRLSIK